MHLNQKLCPKECEGAPRAPFGPSVKGQDELEQYGRRNALRVWLKDPETEGENTDTIILDVAKKLNVALEPSEIGRSHRVGRKSNGDGKPRAIIVKFLSHNVRQRLFRARKNNSGIFLSEDLTKKRANIMFKARGLKRDNKIHSCWTTDGRMYIRERSPWGNHDQARVVQIFSSDDPDAYYRDQ